MIRTLLLSLAVLLIPPLFALDDQTPKAGAALASPAQIFSGAFTTSKG